MISRTVLGAAALGLLAIVATNDCAPLPVLTATCGNKVIDPGEDCDSFGDPSIQNSSCIAAGQPSACHYACDVSACPATYTCGADRVCRKPSGTFSKSSAVAGESTRRVSTGDFDGDGAMDVVTVGSSSRIHFFDGRNAAQQISLSSESSMPALGDLTGDGRTSGVVVSTFTSADLTALQGNLRVWRGSADRTLLPTVYPNIDLTAQNVADGRSIAAFRGGQPGTDIFALLTIASVTTLDYVVGSEPSFVPQPMFVAGLPAPASIEGQIPVGVIGTGSCLGAFNVCQNIVLAAVGASSVGVYPICNGTFDTNNHPNVNYLNKDHVSELVLPLTNDVVAGPAFLIRAPNEATPSLFVVGQKGIWKFPATPCGLSTTGAIDTELPMPPTSKILALGYVEETQSSVTPHVDWVDLDGIHVKYGPGDASTYVSFTPAPSSDADAGTAWIDARIDDFNLNGLADVVALSPTSLDFYNGTGSDLLNPKHITLDGVATHLEVGDFDGDFVSDFVVSTQKDSTGLPTDDIAIAFGQFTGFPAAPSSVGRLGSIGQLQRAFFDYRLDGASDFINSLFAVGTAESGHIVLSILEGSPDRLINSPFFLAPTSKESLVSAVVGSFDTSKHTSLAGFAAATGKPGLWYAPVTGDAQLDVTSTLVSPAPLPNVPMRLDQFERNGMIAVDVGGPDGDELLVVQGEQKGAGFDGLFLVTSPTQSWQVLANETLPGAAPLAEKGAVVLRKGDLDGNKFDDVIIEYADTSKGGAFGAKILMNAGDGKLSFASAITPDLPAGTIALTTIHASPDGKIELLAVAHDGAYIASFANGAVGTFTRVVDLTTLTQDGGAMTVRDAASGDVDGDGVDDVIIGTSTGFVVYFGDPLDP